MVKKVSVLVGAGSIGQAIIRRVSAGKHIVLADYSLEHAEQAAKTLENAGFLIDGGCTASYWYGDLQYLKATH